MKTQQTLSLFEAFLPIIILITLLGINVYIFGDDTLSGSNQMALLIAAAVGVGIGFHRKVSFDGMIKAVAHNISTTLGAILILLIIGALAGTWMLSGTIPTLIVYGLKLLNPHIFLFTASILCAVISVVSGSSWSTIATIGVALLGIGKALGFSEAVVAGAIISGAYFGDKMSPLSDTTNLASAIAGADLFVHIRYMLYTTIPSFTINLLLFLIIGFFWTPESVGMGVEELSQAISSKFVVSPLLMLVPIVTIALIILKMKPLVVLFLSTLCGALFALVFQPDLILEIGGNASYGISAYKTIMQAMTMDTSVATGHAEIDDLLSTGGMSGMLNTVWLIISALTFGGVMESIGALHKISSMLLSGAKKAGSLIATATGTCLFINVTASDQYLALVIPGKMYEKPFRDAGLAPQNLSRTLEDSGTVTSVLIPWNTCGATQSAVLGVATFAYLPYCFFNYISPIMTVLFGVLRIKLAKTSPLQKV